MGTPMKIDVVEILNPATYGEQPKIVTDKLQYLPSSDKQDEAFEACCQGKLDVLKKIIPSTNYSNAILNRLDKHSYSLLHYAARYNHLEIVKFLLTFDPDTNIKGGEELCTPLHIAAMYKCANNEKSQSQEMSLPKSVQKSIGSTYLKEQWPTKPKYPPKKVEVKFTGKEAVYDCHGALIPDLKLTNVCKLIDKPSKSPPHRDTIINALIMKSSNINARDRNDATPLCYAAMKRNVAALSELLEYYNVDIEAKDVSWMTPLHYAAEQGCATIAKILLERNANFRALNKFDMTPLHLACEEGHPEVARLILATIKDKYPQGLAEYINKKDVNRQSPLHYAATSGVVELVALLLEYGATCDFDHILDYTTPLHLACVTGDIEIVKMLVENDPKVVNIKNQDQETPLMIAASLNRTEIVTYLLNHGVDLECFDNDQETALFYASKKDHIETLKILADAGARLDKRNVQDFNQLHVAAQHNSLRVAEYLLSTQLKDYLQNSWDRQENRPIHLAVINNHYEMAKMLIANSAPIDEKNIDGCTPLLLAASKGYIDILKYLIDVCLPLAVDEDDKNNTGVHLAAENGHYRVIPILVNSGVNVDYRNSQQMTALDIACSNGNYKTALALIESDASINTSEKSKHSPPLMMACKHGHAEVVTLLLNRGAIVTKIDSSGRNCLQIAIEENRKDAVLAILNSSKWKDGLRQVCEHNGLYTSPFRRMIETMPEMAEVVLDKCISDNQFPKNHPKYKIECNYEFLEDMHTLWGDNLKNIPISLNHYKNISVFSTVLDYLSDFFRINHFKRNNRNHPLSLMIEKGRYDMIGHPLIRYLVRKKWESSSFYIYYFRILLLILNIVFLTGLCLATASPPYKCIKHNQSIIIEKMNHSYYDNTADCVRCPYIPLERTVTNVIFVQFGKHAVFIFSFFLIMQKTLEVYSNIYNIMTAQSMFEIFGVVSATAYASGLLSYGNNPIEIISFYRCTNTFRSIGALALCFSWLSFVLYLTKLPKIGIYIVMYTEIFRTFLQFVPVYFMLIISFSLPFYMLFLDRYSTNAYVTPFKSIMKTFVATVGEIEYDTFYNTSDEPPLSITYLILFLFLLVNSIILMNLLVGLAVDDIQGVQSKAFLKRLALRIKMSMEFESMMKDHWSGPFDLEQSIHPNEAKVHPFWSWWEFKSNPFEENKRETDDQFETLRVSLKEMKDSFRVLKHQLKNINDKNQRIESMLEELLQKDKDTECNQI